MTENPSVFNGQFNVQVRPQSYQNTNTLTKILSEVHEQ